MKTCTFCIPPALVVIVLMMSIREAHGGRRHLRENAQGTMVRVWEDEEEDQHDSSIRQLDYAAETSRSLSKSKSPSASKQPKSCKSSTKNPSSSSSSKEPSTKTPKSSRSPSSSKSPKSSSSDEFCEEDSSEDLPTFPPTARRCFSGNSGSVAEQCAANNATCCTGSACSFANGTVCENSCNDNLACSMGTAAFVFVEEGSCNGIFSCSLIGGANARVRIGMGSCNGTNACFQLGSSGGDRDVVVGDNSCNGPSRSCTQLGQNFAGPIDIGSNACQDFKACAAFGFTPGIFDGTNNLTIGDAACNGRNQCSGDTTAGGSLFCRDADGTFGTNLPPMATEC